MSTNFRNYEDAQEDTNNKFGAIIQPILEKTFFKEHTFYSNEANKGIGINSIMDDFNGVDVWCIDKRKRVRGIASRIQDNCYRSYDTFTVRYLRETNAPTEYHKRKHSIENNYLYPYYTLQAYISDTNTIFSIGIAKTSEIIRFIDQLFQIYKDIDNIPKKYIRVTGENQKGQAIFFVINWHEYKTRGYKLFKYRNQL